MSLLRAWPALVLLCLGQALPAHGQPSVISGSVSVPGYRATGAVVYLVSEGTTNGSPPGNTRRLAPQPPALIDQFRLRFVPTVLAVLPGSAVEFRNSDALLHNVFSPPGPGDGFNLGTYPKGEFRSHTFTELGPHVILCHVHPEMVSRVIVVDTPVHAVVDPEGRFRIENVPPGRYTLKVWHPAAAPFAKDIVVRAGVSSELRLELGKRKR
jgi:plastocyanin